MPVANSPLNVCVWACSQKLLLLAGCCLGLNSASSDGMDDNGKAELLEGSLDVA